MNQVRLEGMKARAGGLSRAANPHPLDQAVGQEWLAGYDLMGVQIDGILHNAQQLLDGLRELAGSERSRMRLVS